jgi:RNA polymerase sigma-70 factor, ECF subfamily
MPPRSPLNRVVPLLERLDPIYQMHAGALFRFLLRLTDGNRGEAEDHLQETFLRAWRAVQRQPLDLKTIRPWLFTVARRSRSMPCGPSRSARQR